MRADESELIVRQLLARQNLANTFSYKQHQWHGTNENNATVCNDGGILISAAENREKLPTPVVFETPHKTNIEGYPKPRGVSFYKSMMPDPENLYRTSHKLPRSVCTWKNQIS